MDLLQNRIQNYAWGSHTALAELQGRPSPSEKPEAELWMGAHPIAPSKVLRGGAWRGLDELIAEDPERELGARALAELGPRLPFLLKVLSAAEPLSLQAHPTMEQARAGFAREEARGIPRDAPNRCYRDQSHKPELIVALTRFHALSGFRSVERSRLLLEALAVPELGFVSDALAAGDAGLGAAFRAVMTLDPATRERAVANTLAACRAHQGEWSAECGWALRFGELYPGDAGVISALLLNLVVLEPGEAIYLPAGNLHAYLEGVGVEIMASSDNVLRGGLTPKHVDVEELLNVLSFQSGDVEVLRDAYPTPAKEFELSRVVPPARFDVWGPEIVLCIEGSAVLESHDRRLELAKGESAFVSAADGSYAASGTGTLFRATMGR